MEEIQCPACFASWAVVPPTRIRCDCGRDVFVEWVDGELWVEAVWPPPGKRKR